MQVQAYRIEAGGSDWMIVIENATGQVVAHVRGVERALALFGAAAFSPMVSRTCDRPSRTPSYHP